MVRSARVGGSVATGRDGRLRLAERCRVVVRGVDLDPDVEDLGRLAVARAHQVEVAHEATDGRRGQPLRPGLVADLVLERRDRGDQVRLALGVDVLDDEPPGRGGQQVEPPIGVAAGLADLGERPDAGQRRDGVRARPRGRRG